MDKKKKINITYVDVDKLSPAEYNPRKWDGKAIEKLTASIERFGLVDPLIVNGATNRKNVIVGGHFRYEVAKRLNIKKVPVVYLNIPNIDKEKELNLRLNKNTGSWDIELLKSFDIELLLDIGFDDSELEDIWDEHLTVEDDGFDTAKEIEKISVPKTKPGCIYRLGVHTLGCGDAQDSSFVAKLMAGKKADMVYLDPPYNISLDYGKGIGTNGKYGATLTNDSKTDKGYSEFLEKAIKNSIDHIKDDAHIFCYCDQKYIGLLQNLYRKLSIEPKRVCLWIKNNSNITPKVAFNKVYEPCVYGVRGKPYLKDGMASLNEILNKEIESGNRALDDIYDLIDIWLVKRLPTSGYEHPTEKPPTLHQKPLRRCTKIKDKVVDLFGGSGSTLIACQQLKRVCYMAEIEPIFCDLIIRRYKNLIGGEVVRVS